MWMFPVALACGNTFVLKPPALVPSASLRMAQLLQEAGLPDGVFNVVHCGNEAASLLTSDPRVQAVSFVGSSAVAEHIYTTASAHGKRVQAFGAAKITQSSCRMQTDATVNAIMGGAFGSAGERCMALPVVVAVGDETAGRLIERLKPLIAALRIGRESCAAKMKMKWARLFHVLTNRKCWVTSTRGERGSNSGHGWPQL